MVEAAIWQLYLQTGDLADLDVGSLTPLGGGVQRTPARHEIASLHPLYCTVYKYLQQIRNNFHFSQFSGIFIFNLDAIKFY